MSWNRFCLWNFWNLDEFIFKMTSCKGTSWCEWVQGWKWEHKCNWIHGCKQAPAHELHTNHTLSSPPSIQECKGVTIQDHLNPCTPLHHLCPSLYLYLCAHLHLCALAPTWTLAPNHTHSHPLIPTHTHLHPCTPKPGETFTTTYNTPNYPLSPLPSLQECKGISMQEHKWLQGHEWTQAGTSG